MAKQRTLVCLVSDQAVPNYLFIKELYQFGDEILLVASDKMKDKVSKLAEALNWTNANILTHVLSNIGIEDDFIQLRHELSSLLEAERQYVANLTGGNKPMAIALYEQMKAKANSEMYYMPYGKMHFQQIETGERLDVKTKITLADYFAMYGIIFRPTKSTCLGDRTLADAFFKVYTTKMMNKEVVEALKNLQPHRNDKSIDITAEVASALDYFGYLPKSEGKLTKKEIEYLTGGWFEEWAYYGIKEQYGLGDEYIAINAHIGKSNNELDVVLVRHNMLQIVECKSGIEDKKMLNSHLAKANSIKANIKALSATSTLLDLSGEKSVRENWKMAADAIGIGYMGKEALMDKARCFAFVK